MSTRKAAAGLVAGVAATAATAVVGVAAAAPAGAAQTTSLGDEFHLAGDFYDDPEGSEELFIYVRGLAPDALLSFARVGGPGSEVDYESFPFQVNGSYTPVAGDFDGDGWDEILWYTPGAGADWLWNFDGSLMPSSAPYTVNGTYLPFAGDFTGDGTDDILWYGTGMAQDYIWEYDAGGSYRTVPFTANGTYKPLVGSFGQNATDDIFFYAPGPAHDYLWDFAPGSLNYASSAHPVNGTYFPFVLDIFADGWRGGDIFWYAPGSSPDSIWDFYQGTRQTLPISVNGSYLPIAGDLLGDGHSDIVWSNANGFALWDYYPNGVGGVVRYDYDFFATATASSFSARDGGVPDEAPESATPEEGASLRR